jgi:hypothetical protein
MQNLLRQAYRPARAIMVTAAVATATLAGIAGTAGTAASAATAAPAGHAVRLVSTTLASQEFDGFGEGRSAFLALTAARKDAQAQATAAGFSICSTIFEDSGFDPGFGTYVAESDISCTG